MRNKITIEEGESYIIENTAKFDWSNLPRLGKVMCVAETKTCYVFSNYIEENTWGKEYYIKKSSFGLFSSYQILEKL